MSALRRKKVDVDPCSNGIKDEVICIMRGMVIKAEEYGASVCKLFRFGNKYLVEVGPSEYLVCLAVWRGGDTIIGQMSVMN